MLLASIFMPLIAIFYFGLDAEIAPMQFYRWTAFSYTPWIILRFKLNMLKNHKRWLIYLCRYLKKMKINLWTFLRGTFQ
ncbi:hypothetical protein [Scatolibacter rhodanostii]|uniref:hypothetical protein n=1 Tax=Scatolibacter rhodanostii TaxID=2014781 RepID=UPI001FA83CFF|nr:hypothetical protein [Scatolibacter rhodanostii]